MPPPGSPSRRHWIAAAAGATLVPWAARAASPAPDSPAWEAIEKAARGQAVYFNAWAGSERINAYLQWAGEEVARRYEVRLEHVKIVDAAEAVQRVRAEKAAGRGDGSVDLLWLNGENFVAMKREGLLFGPFAEALPAYAKVDTLGKPTTRVDFSEPVDGMEAPWGMAQLTFFADRRRVPEPPLSAAELLAWTRARPGRFTYPKPPQFIGTTFLKQMLSELAGDRRPLQAPVTPGSFGAVATPLWTYLNQLHPTLWRGGRQFPSSPNQTRQMVADGELSIFLSFNPSEAATQIAARALPDTVYGYQHRGGTIGNTHFLAIPFNARAKEGAQVLANFLLSPLAQARKADVRHWGDPTVLAMEHLSAEERLLFDGPALPGRVLYAAPALPELHASWVEALESEWTRRYAQ